MGFGDSLRNAIERLRTSSIDKETVKEAVKELQRALIGADVEIALVLKLSAATVPVERARTVFETGVSTPAASAGFNVIFVSAAAAVLK